jgi:S1-C subfamily serine protease
VFTLVAVTLIASASAVRAQEASTTLGYSLVDRATVRVFAVQGVGAGRVPTSSGHARMIAVPEASHGSGLLVSEDGMVVTARHVVEHGRVFAVWVPGRERAYEAQLVWTDDDWDLAVLAIDGRFTDFVTVAPLGRALHVREQVHAIGYPLDPARTDPQSAQGIVSGVLPSGELQLDIGVNPGNSGGPLIDADERVVGMVVARGDVEQGIQSIGIAVPVDPIARLLATLIPGSDPVATARLGLLNRTHGAQVAELVRVIVRVESTELVHDLERALRGGDSDEVLARLRTFSDVATDPDVMAMLAAYLWDFAAIVLERGSGALRPSELAEPRQRELARDLLVRAVRLCFGAARDATMVHRSPFVRWVTHYLAEPAGAGDEPFVLPRTTATAPTRLLDSERPR